MSSDHDPNSSVSFSLKSFSTFFPAKLCYRRSYATAKQKLRYREVAPRQKLPLELRYRRKLRYRRGRVAAESCVAGKLRCRRKLRYRRGRVAAKSALPPESRCRTKLSCRRKFAESCAEFALPHYPSPFATSYTPR